MPTASEQNINHRTWHIFILTRAAATEGVGELLTGTKTAEWP